MEKVACKGCGRLIVFAKTPDGKTMPLDAVSPCYVLLPDGSCRRAESVFVSHFVTCPRREQFSGKGKTA